MGYVSCVCPELKKTVGNPDFSEQFKVIINRHKWIGHRLKKDAGDRRLSIANSHEISC